VNIPGYRYFPICRDQSKKGTSFAYLLRKEKIKNKKNKKIVSKIKKLKVVMK
jgi:hypothetical protein